MSWLIAILSVYLIVLIIYICRRGPSGPIEKTASSTFEQADVVNHQHD